MPQLKGWWNAAFILAVIAGYALMAWGSDRLNTIADLKLFVLTLRQPVGGLLSGWWFMENSWGKPEPIRSTSEYTSESESGKVTTAKTTIETPAPILTEPPVRDNNAG